MLDGGTDFGHPDLIGTWQTWSGADAIADDAWNGWPKAFDPFGTLQCAARPPATIDAGLTLVHADTRRRCPAGGSDTCRVDFATRTGPSRNFAAPGRHGDAHATRFPRGLDEVGHRPARQPPRRLPARRCYGERPAFLVADPTTAGVYDTVYVDLDDDHNFADEKPVTKAVAAS